MQEFEKAYKHNPQVYLPDVANTLGAYGLTYLYWGLPNKAKPLLIKATQILSPFAKQLPAVFGDKQAYFLLRAAQADPEDTTFIYNAMTEAAKVAQSTDLKAEVIETSNLYCKTESN